jgi:hypothetical protein
MHGVCRPKVNQRIHVCRSVLSLTNRFLRLDQIETFRSFSSRGKLGRALLAFNTSSPRRRKTIFMKPYVFALLTALAIVTSGCRKPAAPKGPAIKPNVDVPKPIAAAPVAVPTVPVRVASDLDYIPAQSELVAQIDVESLRRTPLYSGLIQPALAKTLANNSYFTTFKKLCNFDPTIELTSIIIGATQLNDDNARLVALVAHGVDNKRTMQCLATAKASAFANGGKVEQHGNNIEVANRQGETAWLTFIDDRTVVIQIGKSASESSLNAMIAGKSGLSSSIGFTDLYRKVSDGNARFLFNDSSKKLPSSTGLSIKQAYGNITISDVATMIIRLRMSSAAEASKRADEFRSQISAIKSMVQDVSLTAEAADIIVTTKMTDAQIRSFIGLAGGMLR